MDRNELQKQAVMLLERDKRLLCQWATGVGKSNVVLKFLQRHPGYYCLILVPEQNNIQNWLDEFAKFNVPTDNVQIICYASFHKYERTQWNLLVFDEAPHLDTQKRLKIGSSVKGNYVLALGAVIDDDETYALEACYGKFTKNYISLKQAIQWKILPCPTVNICHISLDNKNKKYLYKGVMYTAKEMYDIHQNNVDKAVGMYNISATSIHKRRMLSMGSARKRFLGTLKTEAVQMLCDKLTEHHKRFLCFCVSIAQARELGGDLAFTSKTPASAKLLERFNNHEIDSLYVVGKLIEGQNLTDIEHGVITQLGGTSRITVQSIGRIMRSKEPVIWIPIVFGTKDDSFLRTVTYEIPEDYIHHYNL